MSLEADQQIDRRRLKRGLATWRIVAVVALVVAATAWIGHTPGGIGGRDRVARLSVSGVITDNRRLLEAIDAAGKDEHVKALLLVVDSPGGSVAGGEGLHDALLRVQASKPVVAVMGGTAASAGYMISVAAERIFARSATLTGSIGVILQTGEVSGLLDKLGIGAEALVSGPLKDQPSFTKPLSRQGREVLQALVMDLYDQFVGMVAAGRHMDAARVRDLADGRAYTGRQALALGLVDEIGGEPEARAWLAHAHHVDESLPTTDLRREGGSWLRRSLVGMSRDIVGAALKTIWLQGVSVDGAWALWQGRGQE